MAFINEKENFQFNLKRNPSGANLNIKNNKGDRTKMIQIANP